MPKVSSDSFNKDVSVQLTLVNGDESFVPSYANVGDAGCDGKANLTTPIHIHPGDTALIPLGIKVAVPQGFELQVRSRSGLALKHAVVVSNSPGCVDSPYRGEVCAILINHGEGFFKVNPGDRICQLVLNKVEKIQWDVVEELPTSERGLKGFGSSGV